MELILAVGLKLSTKSDIKLPRSYKEKRHKKFKEKTGSASREENYLLSDKHVMAEHRHN